MTMLGDKAGAAPALRRALSFVLWPGLMAGCIACTALGIEAGRGFLIFNVTYLGLALALFALERVMPHERRWLENCGQIGPDLAHTLFTKGFAQGLLAVGTTVGLVEALAPQGGGLWPLSWPIWAQILLGLVIAEFGLYWAHRLAHEVPQLWRFHAVHHSVKRLWFFNTGRFHFIDMTISLALSQPLLFLAGAPKEVFIWVSAITAYVGMLTHCNVEMRFGPLNYLFNTPALHRWHHSMNPAEGNRNYGENLMLFDHLFGSYFNAARRPPAEIGIAAYMPRSFLGQLLLPFLPRRAALRLQAQLEPV